MSLNISKIFCNSACKTFCTAAFNNLSLTHPLTGGAHASKHVCASRQTILAHVVVVLLQINLRKHRKQNLASLIDRYCK